MGRLCIHPRSPHILHEFASEIVEGFDLAVVETTPSTQFKAGSFLDFQITEGDIPRKTLASVMSDDRYELAVNNGLPTAHYIAAMNPGIRGRTFVETIGTIAFQALRHAQDTDVDGGMWISLAETAEERFGLNNDNLVLTAFEGIVTGIKRFFTAMHEEDPEYCLSAVAIGVSPHAYRMLTAPAPLSARLNPLMTSGGIFRVVR